MITIRQQLVDKITTRLGEIRTANGYVTDIGLRVFPRRRVPLDAASCPAIVFCDADATTTTDEATIGSWVHQLLIDIEVYATGAAGATFARSALEDVVKAVFRTNGEYWDGLADFTELTGHSVDLEPLGDLVAACRASFVITYRTVRGLL